MIPPAAPAPVLQWKICVTVLASVKVSAGVMVLARVSSCYGVIASVMAFAGGLREAQRTL